MGATERTTPAVAEQRAPPSRVLDAIALSPLERGCEIVFGILMFVSVTAAAEIGTNNQISANRLFLAAFGCNPALGLIDGVVYLMQLQFERFRHHRALIELRAIGADESNCRRTSARP
jgi:hypothetical protein